MKRSRESMRPMDSHLRVENNTNTSMESLKSATQGIDNFFVFPPDNRPNLPHDQFDRQIPVIDMSPVLDLEKVRKELAVLEEQGKERRSILEKKIKDYEAAKVNVQKEIGAACEEYGFFQIVNHGVSPQVLKQLVECCQHIFDLPVEEKMKVEGGFLPTLKGGYGPMTRKNGYTMIDKSHIWNEGFDVESPELTNPGRMEEIASILWPEESSKTSLGLQLKSSSEECGQQFSEVTSQLLKLMVGCLDLPEESLEELLGPDFPNKQGYARLRINHYPQCLEPEKTWGFPSHTDSSIITVLHQDSIGGLQIRFRDGSWHGVRPIDGALVINVGDFLQVWTNRRFLSAEHRAVANNKGGRISVGYFAHRMDDFVLGPCLGLLDAEHPPRYRSFNKKEYFQKTYASGMSKDRDQVLDQEFGTDAQTRNI